MFRNKLNIGNSSLSKVNSSSNENSLSPSPISSSESGSLSSFWSLCSLLFSVDSKSRLENEKLASCDRLSVKSSKSSTVIGLGEVEGS